MPAAQARRAPFQIARFLFVLGAAFGKDPHAHAQDPHLAAVGAPGNESEADRGDADIQTLDRGHEYIYELFYYFV